VHCSPVLYSGVKEITLFNSSFQPQIFEIFNCLQQLNYWIELPLLCPHLFESDLNRILYNNICHCACLEDKRRVSILQTLFTLRQIFCMLIHFIQQHVLADYKPFWCNATKGDEQYNVVTSPTAVFYTRCCFIYKFKQWQSALILSFHDW